MCVVVVCVVAVQTLRNLSNNSYEKRKLGALEVERAVRAAHSEGRQTVVSAIVDLLVRDFTNSHIANYRKGGVIALAGTAVGLVGETSRYLDRLVPAVIKCFGDQEARVRYYACEAMFNIAKMAKDSILAYFDVVFVGLCRLFADVDVDVKNGAAMLDRMLKDLVTESPHFDIDSFIPLLKDHMTGTNPYVRVVLVGWIRDLDTVPDIDMLDHLPALLAGLFDMLSDNNREIRQQAYGVLNKFLEDIQKVPDAEFESRVIFRPMIEVLVAQCASEEKFNRNTAMWWIHQFILLGKQKLVSVYATLLESILHCISDTDFDTRREAKATNADLLSMARESSSGLQISELLRVVTTELPSDHKYTRLAALKWISMLLEKSPEQMLSMMDELLPALLHTLADDSDDVVKITLEVLARVCLDEAHFLRVLNDIVHLFAADRKLLEVRGSFIIRRLCVLMDAKRIYITLAQILADEENLTFASIMIETLNLILLTSEELTDLREQLRYCVVNADADGVRVFTTLYRSWCHNPIATFTICLLSQAYDLGAIVVSRFSEAQITVGLLMQIDKLVQLIESPVFVHLRAQLLRPELESYKDLLRSLYGLLMLLPQSRAFNTLRNRLMSVTSLHIALGSAPGTTGRGEGDVGGAGGKDSGGAGRRHRLDLDDLLRQYDEAQKEFLTQRAAERSSRRLRTTGGGAATSADS